MSAIDTEINASIDQPFAARIAVLLEPGRRGVAALAEAAALGATPGSELTIVAVAPKAGTPCRSCGGVSARAYNCAVRDDVAEELQKSIASVCAGTQRIKGQLLVEGDDLPLERWVAQGSFDLVLLPSRWGVLRSRRHPAARLLQRHTDAKIRVVDGPVRLRRLSQVS